MANLNVRAPPPHIHLTPAPGHQISPAAALAHIQDYLEQTKTAPHLHPDAEFSEVGISVSNNGGVALHQLRRVEQGLQGVFLSRDLSLEWLGQETASEPQLDYQAQLRELGEGIVEGEVGDRNNAVRDGGEEPIVRESVKGKKRRFEEMEDGYPVKDKEARKRAKAERRKQERKERQKEREAKSKVVDAVDELDDEDLIINGTAHDETRQEHDDAGPSTAHLPDKISSTITKTPKEVKETLPNGFTDSNHSQKETDTETSNQRHENEEQDSRNRVREGKDQVQVPSSYEANALATPAPDEAVVEETPPSKVNGHVILNGELPLLSHLSGSEDQREDDEEAKAKRKAEKRRKKDEKRARREKKEKKRENKQV